MTFDLILALFVLASVPRILCSKKKFPTFREWFGSSPPEGEKALRIWIHAVSVGEVKAAQSLVERLFEREIDLLITTTTVAGNEEAQRSFPRAVVRFMPLDFSWIMRRWMRSFRPDYLIFVEGDLWPNLLREAKRNQVRTALVSGKISQKSCHRFGWVPKLCRTLFDRIDLLAVQNEQQRERFAKLTQMPIHVLGNLKFDQKPCHIDHAAVRARFTLSEHQPAITVASTHAPEERELLTALRGLWEKFPNLVIFLAPRHPERFEEVGQLLNRLGIAFSRWLEPRNNNPVVLVDTMGQLFSCYAVSNLAIVAGSFSSRVGGHNVLEPCSVRCPVLFGPEMFGQQELAQFLLKEKAAAEVLSQELEFVVERELINPTLSCQHLSLSSHCAERFLAALNL